MITTASTNLRYRFCVVIEVLKVPMLILEWRGTWM